ncbi:MAG TPA: 2-phosphosulfolactate phosphatase [Nitrospinota bacterium]|nr:2-phosphosulfolactate phosphatase [Nitrospinota bacterium]
MKVNLLFTPEELDYIGNLEDKIAIVIDIIRTTTTITTAFKNGCSAIIPVLTLEDAFQRANKIGKDKVLLAGAQKGERIEGFQLGNSPREYGEDIIKNKIIIMKTTNGTKTLKRASSAKEVFISSFMNITALIKKLQEYYRDTIIVCSGLGGLFSLEDTVCGGMIIEGLIKNIKNKIKLSDSALAATIIYNRFKDNIFKMLEKSEWGNHLIKKGGYEDLKICASIDKTNITPRMKKERIII